MSKKARFTKTLRSKKVLLLGFTALILLVVFMIRPAVMSAGNMRGVLNNLCVQGTLMAGIGTLLISGAIDLSTDAQAGFAGLVFALILWNTNIPWPIAAVMALLVGVCMGGINILLTNVLNIMPFIASIGMSSVYIGVSDAITRANVVAVANKTVVGIGRIVLFGRIPLLFVITVVILLLYSLMLVHSSFGRSIYMVGGNPTAARLAGLNPKKVRAILFINNSVIASFAGLMWVSQRRLGLTSQMVAGGHGMSAITAAILGGIGFMGGSGGLAGACIGMLLLNIFDNALTVLQISPYVNMISQGMILIAALILDHFSTSKMASGGSLMSSGR